MKKLSTLLLSVLLFTAVMAQKTAEIEKTTVKPIVDGIVDELWADVEQNAIDVVQAVETPTVGESWWKMLWDDDGLFMLVFVDDDVYMPAHMGLKPANSWNYDKVEVYFDVNSIKQDAGAPGTEPKAGHYQFAETPLKAIEDGGTNTTKADGVQWAFNATDRPAYYVEYFIPFEILLDKDLVQVDKSEPIGFDMNIMDGDVVEEVRNRMNWSHAGVTGENWNNMDEAGLITLLGAEAPTYIDAITLNTDGAITTDNGTLQMVATLDPEDASNKKLRWTVTNGTGSATIDSNGLLKGITDGTVTVTAASTDGWGAEAQVDIEISGQVIDRSDIWNSFNLVKNWNFNTMDASTASGLAFWGGWLDGDSQMKAVVEAGVVAMTTAVFNNAETGAVEQYHYQFSQSGFNAEPNVPYVVSFKSWADVERPNTFDFEDIEANSHNRYGVTTDPESGNGRSEWAYNLTTEAQWFVFNVTFDQIVETTVQKMQWMQSQAAGTIYLDSVLLVTKEQYDLLATLPTTGVKQLANSITKVYPNPVGNGSSLFVELSKANTKVAIYNAVGQKMMEKVSTGNMAQFDVSSLRQGMYFVKTSDGGVQKFIR